MMFFCISCKVVHKDEKQAISIFKTGFHIMNGNQVPVGFCNEESPDINIHAHQK
jgi:hypothetical protein